MRANTIKAIFGIAVASLTIGGCYHYQYGTREWVTVTVTDKERVTTRSGETITSVYLIFSGEGETFECSDNLFQGKFNSSDVYGKMERGGRYECLVNGCRIPFLSHYRNILEVR